MTEHCICLEKWSSCRCYFFWGLAPNKGRVVDQRTGPGNPGMEDELHQASSSYTVFLSSRQKEHTQTERSMSICFLYLTCAAVEVEQSSYEDDLQILRVIEAYCFSKQRQTITNSGEST